MEKKNLCVALLLTVLAFCNCSTKLQFAQTSEVKYNSYVDGVITVNTIGFGNNKSESIYQAEKNAFEVLFFRGLPESPLNKPLIDNEQVKNEKSSFFKSFYSENRYKSFITYSNLMSEYTKKQQSISNIEMSINVSALRKELESNGIIKKFGLY